MSEHPRGPFRDPELTADARRTKEHDASWGRVQRLTDDQIDGERRSRERGDALAWLGLALALFVSGVSIALAFGQGGSWTPLVCPAIALAIASMLLLGHRARLRKRR